MQATVPVFVADDSELLKQGIISWLSGQKEFRFSGNASHWEEFTSKVKTENYPIVISTIQWINSQGKEEVEGFMKKFPSVRFIVIFTTLEVQKISGLLQMGIKGFINTTISKEEFLKALEKVQGGNHYFASNIFESGFTMPSEEIADAEDEDSNLTNREAEVLELISHGYTTREIADRLKISKRTVDGHRARLLNKIGVRNTAGLVRYALGFKLGQKNLAE